MIGGAPDDRRPARRCGAGHNGQPLLILLPAWWLFGERVSWRTGFALVVGFGGLLVVAVPGGGGRGALLSLLAAVAVTAGTLMARRLGDVDVVVVSAAHLMFGGLVLAILALVAEGPPDIDWTPGSSGCSRSSAWSRLRRPRWPGSWRPGGVRCPR